MPSEHDRPRTSPDACLRRQVTDAPVLSRLRHRLENAVADARSAEERPATATAWNAPTTSVQPFSLASTARVAIQRAKREAKLLEQEEAFKQRAVFKARRPPKEIYGDASPEALLQRRAKRKEDHALQKQEDWGRLSTFKARPVPQFIKAAYEQHRAYKEAAYVSPADPRCTSPPPAADLRPWRLRNGMELRGHDAYAESDPPMTAAPTGRAAGGSAGGSLAKRLREAVDSSGAGVHGGGLYGMAEYWDERYTRRPLAREGRLKYEEWYAPYASVRMSVLPLLRPADRILHVGCGQSRLGADLYEDGFCHVLNMDLSAACIEQMRSQFARSCPKMLWRQMDMTNLECADGSVEAIVDKGSIDALMCTGGSAEKISACIDEFHRVLVSGGVYVCMTGQSRTATFLAQQSHAWRVSARVVDESAIGRRPLTIVTMHKRESPKAAPASGQRAPLESGGAV